MPDKPSHHFLILAVLIAAGVACLLVAATPAPAPPTERIAVTTQINKVTPAPYTAPTEKVTADA